MFRPLARLSERITVASGGRLVVKAYSSGAIVPMTEESKGVNTGMLDFAMTTTADMRKILPWAALLNYQIGGLSPIESLMWHLVGGGHELFKRVAAEAGLGNANVLPAALFGPEIFIWSNKELKGPDDLKGLKYRSGGGDEVQIMGNLGVAAVVVPVAEVYEAMQRGVVDALQVSSPAMDYSLGIHEAAKIAWLSPVRQPAEIHQFWVNKDSWAELPDDLKVMVEDLCLATGLENYAHTIREDTLAIEKFREYGTIILPVPTSIEQALLDASADFYAEKRLGENPLMGEILDSIDAFKKTYREAFQRL